MALRSPGLGSSTRRAYLNAIEHSRPLWDLRLDALRANHVQAWLNQLLTSKAPKTVALSRNVVNQAMVAAVEWERIPRNPVTHADIASVKPVRERHAWSATDVRRFLTGNRTDPMRALWVTLLFTGMRQGEARALRWEDIDFERGTILVAASLDDRGIERGPTKTKTKQRVPMVGPVAAALREHWRNGTNNISRLLPNRDGNYVFTRDDGRPLTGEFVRWHFRAACTRAGLEPLVPHEMRHTTATLLADEGVPILTVASILGHASTDQLRDTYHHSQDAERRKALEALSERLSG